MSVIMDVYSLIKDLKAEAEKSKNEELISKLIVIEKQVVDIDKTNQELQRKLDIREKMMYDENVMSFTLPQNPNIHYCSICYGKNEQLIPIINGKCRCCEERWLEAHKKE